MNRSFNKLLFLLLIGIQNIAYATEDDRFAAVKIKAQHLAESVHMLEGAGGNIGVSAGVDGTLIIDDQFAPLADKILVALEGLGGDRPKLILNTHFHGDHTGSNPTLGIAGTIISHENVRFRLLTQDHFPRSGLPLVTFNNELKVHFNDDELRLIHLPDGHTDGDIAVWFQRANVIHMGDHFFKNQYPFIDVSNGGSIDGFISNIEKVLSLIPDDIKIIPGHGSLATKHDLTEALLTVKQSTHQVRTALAHGRSPEEIASELDLKYPNHGLGFISAERWVQIIQADNAK